MGHPDVLREAEEGVGGISAIGLSAAEIWLDFGEPGVYWGRGVFPKISGTRLFDCGKCAGVVTLCHCIPIVMVIGVVLSLRRKS